MALKQQHKTAEMWRPIAQRWLNCHSKNVWFQKISIPPPPTEDHWKFRGGGGFKGSNFRGVGRVHGKLFSKGWQTMYKTLKSITIDLKHKNIPTYVVKLKQKSVLLAIDMRLTSLALMFLFFFELASATISRRTMCFWNEVETDWKWRT